MQNKRIAIIGGGIGGLSCLHFLAKQGVTADLFEAENRVGGRIYTFQNSSELGAYVFHEQYHTLLEIIADMELADAIQEKQLEQAGFSKNDQLILLNPFKIILSLLTKKLRVADVRCLFKLLSSAAQNYRYFFNFLHSYSQDNQANDIIEFAKANPQIVSQYQQSFLHKENGFTKDIFDYFIAPIIRKLLFQNPEELNFLMGNAIFGAKTFKLKTLAGGLSCLTNKLFERYQKHIYLSSKVDEIKHEDNLSSLTVNGQQKIYDMVVLATPGSRDTSYAKGSVTVVEGKLKPAYSQCGNLLLNNVQGWINGITKHGNNIYNVYSMGFPGESELNLPDFFSSHKIMYRQAWENVMPKTNLKLFSNNTLKQNNIFYVGDFLSPAMEVSAVTGKKAAQQIVSLCA